MDDRTLVVNLDAWLRMYVSPHELLVKIEPRHFRPDVFGVQMGILRRSSSVTSGSTAHLDPLYTSHDFNSKELALRQCEELLRAIQRDGRAFFERSGDPTRIMLQHRDRLTWDMVSNILRRLEASDVGSMINSNGEIQTEKID